MILVEQMVVLFILMGIGFFCGKMGFISDKNAKNISWIVLNVANPGMILSAAMAEQEGVEGKDLLFVFVIALLTYVFLIFLAYLVPIFIRPKPDEVGLYRVMTIFSNIGFMGFPILSATYGSTALLYASLFQLPFNLLIYTYGIAQIKGESLKGQGFSLKKVINVGVVSCLLAVVIFVFHVPMPDFVQTTAKSLSGLTAPLSMMVIGQSMIHMSIKDLVSDTRLIIFSLMKQILIPIIGIAIIRLFVQDDLILHVCYIMLATPIGGMSAMLAQQYDRNYGLASRGVAFSTVMSVITIPLVELIIF